MHQQYNNLHILKLDHNAMITNAGLKKMTQLTSLDLSRNTRITDEVLEYLPNLKYLYLNHNRNISNVGLKMLTNLTFLELNKSKATCSAVESLPKLKCFNMLRMYTNVCNVHQA